jgi:hypothetical protein
MTGKGWEDAPELQGDEITALHGLASYFQQRSAVFTD